MNERVIMWLVTMVGVIIVISYHTQKVVINYERLSQWKNIFRDQMIEEENDA